MTDLAVAFRKLVGPAVEGGYANDPHDPGGETKYGITKRDHPDVDIPNLTEDGAKAIYDAEFWRPLRLGEMPQTVANRMLNIAANCSNIVAALVLQRGVNALDPKRLAVDGVIGPETLGAVREADERALVLALRVGQGRYYSRLLDADPKRRLRYARTWIRRAMF